jgi:hypothetical protein
VLAPHRRRPATVVLLALAAAALGACGDATRPPAKVAVPTAPAPAPLPPPVVAETPKAPPGLWHFEWLSPDGRRALLRRIDGGARGSFDARVVDVDSGEEVDEAALEELAKLPTTTIGKNAVDPSELDALFAAPAFGEDLVRGAQMAYGFPFGSCGRFSAAPKGRTIAFNAGDWLYVADEHGRVKKRVADVAAYDPRFTPDGKSLLFRRATGKIDRVLTGYEMFVVPADLSQPARALGGTAGVVDGVVVDDAGKFAVAVASHEPQVKTCALSVSLRAPFAVKRLACLDGGELLVESILSPHGRWIAAVTTPREKGPGNRRTFRLRVASLESGKVMLDEPAQPGLNVRAISDGGVLVQSRTGETVVIDVPGRTRRARPMDVGHRAYFRSASELVFVQGATVAVLDVGFRTAR